ncbi:hypothetical protein [Herbiconiux sp. L3-i23]|uniref:hypothetical protein n=1 Tax=Herbiconiux sp. L3-i23 TaxID=2905871 RepID=UPI002066A7B5|nr:hypothetical protein [Herbiconiux sp. L3-i23]BDI21724.1 hypothetical protein L3i23_05000 [Herbiconiux sp. L3-i23]
MVSLTPAPVPLPSMTRRSLLRRVLEPLGVVGAFVGGIVGSLAIVALALAAVAGVAVLLLQPLL